MAENNFDVYLGNLRQPMWLVVSGNFQSVANAN
jgi:hypothetical protein